MMKKYIFASLIGLVLGTGVMSAKVIGRINGYPITEKEANTFLKVVTKGKLKFHQLRSKDKKDVIKRIAIDSLLVGMSKKLPQKERNQVIVNYWLSKKIGKISISDQAVKKAYNSNRKFFKNKQGKILPFKEVKAMIAVSLKQKKYVARLLKSAKITMGKQVIQSGKKGRKTSHSSSVRGSKRSYVVKSGNTLSGIAHKYHITVSQLRDLNGMSPDDTLKIGQKLKVPAQ